MARQGQSEVSKQMEVQDKSTVFRVVDPAMLPYKPVAPDRVKMILMGILAGIGGGLALVFIKDKLDGSVKDLEMAKQFGFSVLAVIPRIEDPKKLAAQTMRDRLLYLVAGSYFLLFLLVLAAEMKDIGLIPKIISRLTS